MHILSFYNHWMILTLKMGDTNYIVNSILCFMNLAHDDYSYDSMLEVAYSFYSHEEIKVAKELLCTLLKRDLIWRRDPDKERKDLKDILEYHQELTASKRKLNIVTDTYKKSLPWECQCLLQFCQIWQMI